MVVGEHRSRAADGVAGLGDGSRRGSDATGLPAHVPQVSSLTRRCTTARLALPSPRAPPKLLLTPGGWLMPSRLLSYHDPPRISCLDKLLIVDWQKPVAFLCDGLTERVENSVQAPRRLGSDVLGASDRALELSCSSPGRSGFSCHSEQSIRFNAWV